MNTKLLIIFLFTFNICFSQTPVATAEAENGTRSGGVAIANSIPGYSGTGYVTNFTAAGDKVTVTMNVATTGLYKLVIRYQSDLKTQDLYVNGAGPSALVFPLTSTFADVDAGKYQLNAGVNTFSIQKNWGWSQIDKFSLYAAVKNTYNITPNLINSAASPATKSLYAFLVSNFNVRIISGQTTDWYDRVKTIAGKSPLLRAFDFQHYTQGYSYLYDSSTGGKKFGAEDDGQVQRAIDWYNQTGGKGIVNFHWHWHSPSGGVVNTNTFYTASTSFDVTKAVVPGNVEYTLIIQDIDAIAFQLKRLQTAGVPVLWRPLHEAGGAWFWWGAKGPVACKKLYQIMYDRLTTYHGLNNLIWIWSTPETDWYPGNNAVDMIGYDSYPGVYNYDPQKTAFDRLYTLTNGQKLITMSENGPIPSPDVCLMNENGPIPDPDALFTSDAKWSYFMSWNDLTTAQNSNKHIIDVFNYSYVMTLENWTADVKNVTVVKNKSYQVSPNPAREIVTIEGNPYDRIELIDLNGRTVLSTTSSINKIDISKIMNGMYVLKIYNQHQTFQQKLIINK